MGLTQSFAHRESTHPQFSGRWKIAPSNEKRQERSSTRDGPGDCKISRDRTTHKRKHGTYTENDQQRYLDMSENIPHLSKDDSDIDVNRIGKEAFGVRCTKIVFKKVLFR